MISENVNSDNAGPAEGEDNLYYYDPDTGFYDYGAPDPAYADEEPCEEEPWWQVWFRVGAGPWRPGQFFADRETADRDSMTFALRRSEQLPGVEVAILVLEGDRRPDEHTKPELSTTYYGEGGDDDE
jgi:hypothetical protein